MKRLWATLAAMLVSTVIAPGAARAQSVSEYALNANRSRVDFSFTAKMLFSMKKEGQFKDFTGQLRYDPANPAGTHVDLTVFTASVDMHNAEHDAILKSGDFFDVDHFPTMRFVSEATEVNPDGTYELTGDLTIRGITRRVAVLVKIAAARLAAAVGPAFEATFDINRSDFGLNGSPKFSGMNVSISKNVQIHVALATVPGAHTLTVH